MASTDFFIPAGSVGLFRPDGWVGRRIAAHQDVPYSHACIALGNGMVYDSTWKWTRRKPESFWRKRQGDWWCPADPLNGREADVLKSVAKFTEDRIRYGIPALLAFLLRGRPGKRGHDLFCTYAVAEMLMSVGAVSGRPWDVSGMEQPWNVDPRSLLAWLATSNEFVPYTY